MYSFNSQILSHLLKLVALIILVLSYAFIPGYLLQYPGNIPHFANHVSSLNDIIFNQNAGYPHGIKLSHNLPIEIFHFIIFKLSGLNPFNVYILSDLIILFFALCCGAQFFKFFGINKNVSILLSLIYLVSPFIQGQYLGQYPHAISFALMPTILWLEFLTLQKFQLKNNSIPKKLILILILIVSKSLTLLLNGYLFIIVNLAVLIYLIGLIFVFKRHILITTCGFFIANLVGFLFYREYSPSGGDYSVMPIDFFRGQGQDLISLFIPSKGRWLSDFFNFSVVRSGYAFYGDGSNVFFNYVGITILLSIIIFFIVYRNKPWQVKTFLVAGLLAFLLSLGPSIKFNNQRIETSSDKFSFDNYLMPKEAAMINLPTESIYLKLPGVKNMRSVYRWHILSILTSILILGLLSQYLILRQRYLLAYLLVLLSLAEMIPNIPQILSRAKTAYNQALQYHDDILITLKEKIKEGEKVLVVSSENDFLIMSISKFINAKFYNFHGDKEGVVVSSHWPKEILDIQTNVGNLGKNINLAFRKGHVDQVILPHFSLREHYYYWPPKPSESKCTEININRKKLKCIYENKYDRIIRINN